VKLRLDLSKHLQFKKNRRRHGIERPFSQAAYRNLEYEHPQKVGNIWEQLAPKTA